MRHSLTLISGLLVLCAVSGCRSKDELRLYRPGETQVWRTATLPARPTQTPAPRVELVTSHGTIVVELFDIEAPLSVENFLQYLADGFYEGTIFHRVEPGLVIQAGGFTAAMERKETREPIRNEAGNGLRNNRGTLGLARTSVIDSATSQFFINLVDNPWFNGDGVRDGYAVFGRVTEGMDVVDAIARVDTGAAAGMTNVPVEPVVILSARRLR